MVKSRTKSSVEEIAMTLDHLPERERVLEEIRKVLDALASFYGFEPIYTAPLVDSRVLSSLAKAGMLDERKPLAQLFPSLLLPVFRAYAAHAMYDWPQPLKLRSAGEVFYEESRVLGKETKELSGRYEWGMTVIGDPSAFAEAEMVQVCWKGLEELGIEGEHLGVRLNSAGCAQCRTAFRASLSGYFRSRASRLCAASRLNLKNAPTLILKCSDERCRILAHNAPQILDFLCDLCKKHLRAFLEVLDEARIPYTLDPAFFREGTWYDMLIWEIFHSGLKPAEEKESPPQPVTLGEGGRMSRAAELLTGRKLDAAGSVVFLQEFEKIGNPTLLERLFNASKPVFLVQLGEFAKRKSFAVLETLRKNAIATSASLGRDSIKSQLKLAEKAGATLALILGQKEVLDNTIIVREVGSGIQETIAQEKLVEFLKKKLKK